MNSIQRRLFRAFLEGGGDLAEPLEVERFVRYVEAVLSLLPPKERDAVNMAWRAKDRPRYEQMAARLSRGQRRVTASALRQRVSRALRFTEKAIQRQPWRAAPRSESASRSR